MQVRKLACKHVSKYQVSKYVSKKGLHLDGRTTKGRTTYNRTTNHRTISAMVCTTSNHVCGSLTLICDGMTGHPSP